MKSILSLLGPWRIAALVGCAVLAVAAFILRFCLPGYSFSALVCLCLIAIILFYTLMPLVGLKSPALAKAVTIAVTIVLVLGILVVGVTELVIIRASFGNPQESVDYVVVLGAKVNRPLRFPVGPDLRCLFLSGRAPLRHRRAFRRPGYRRTHH